MAHQVPRAIINEVSHSIWFAIIADEAIDAALVEKVRNILCTLRCYIYSYSFLFVFAAFNLFEICGSPHISSSRGLHWIIRH